MSEPVGVARTAFDIPESVRQPRIVSWVTTIQRLFCWFARAWWVLGSAPPAYLRNRRRLSASQSHGG